MRKQAAVTLRCMQALVRVQARVRARRVRMTVQGQAVQKLLDEHRSKSDLLKEVEVISLPIGLIDIKFVSCLKFVCSMYSQEGWCDRIGTVDDIKTKLQQRQEGAFKRERAMAYALAQKVTVVRTLLLQYLVYAQFLNPNPVFCSNGGQFLAQT